MERIDFLQLMKNGNCQSIVMKNENEQYNIRLGVTNPYTAEAILSELEGILQKLGNSQLTPLQKNISIKLEKIVRELKKLELDLGIKRSLKPNLSEQFEEIIKRQSDSYRRTIYQTLRKACSTILDNSQEIEKMNRIIASLPEAENGELEIVRILSNVEIKHSKAKISRREKEVLIQLLRGKANREISQELCISEKTVKNHLWKVYRKLGVENRTQLFHKLICA